VKWNCRSTAICHRTAERSLALEAARRTSAK
jgi:hypothetical protein